MQPSLNKRSVDKKITDIFFIILFFGILLRIAIGIGYYNPNDTLWYKIWAVGSNDGFFDIYSRAEELSLDYPPIYLFFLRITGAIYGVIGEEVHKYTEMLLMKMWPVLGDIICAVALYLVFKKKSPVTGLVAMGLWMFNPSAIFNGSFWGQTDSIMCLMLLISFVALERDKPILASILFALAGMTKYQSLFFTPLFLAELYYKFKLSNFLKGIGAAAATVVAVFIPFMIGAKNPLLFLDVYLGGQGSYPYCTLNAYNIYGIFGLNWVEDNEGAISLLYPLSFVLIFVLIALMILAYIYAKRKSVWVMGFLFMNTLFMFMTRMHERYQFVVLIFILMAALIHNHRGFFYSFAAMSFITFINQVIPMFSWLSSDSFIETYYGELMVIFSVVNLIIYIITTYVSVKYMFKSETLPKEETV